MKKYYRGNRKKADKAVRRKKPVDAVITWVDGNDPVWQKERAAHTPQRSAYKAGTSDARFRDWDNLQYIFRGIERYMPWIRTVHLVTCGHYPSWINPDCSKLHLVSHRDFIPEEYLPTFNTNTIELNFHRIPGLAEQFIDFNDDMFVIGPTRREDFFEDGLPKDTGVLTPFVVTPNGIAALEMNNLEVINKYFSSADVKKNKAKWINPVYGRSNLRTAIFMQWSGINGIYEPHIPLSFLKSTYETVWEKEPELLHETSLHKFRSKADVTDWLIRHWQLMSGQFVPRDIRFGAYTCLPQDIEKVKALLHAPGKCRLICINDSADIQDFDQMKTEVNAALEAHFPEKSDFEK